ncbi:MAG: hypothetical protein IKO49_06900 [Bacilli bacterium]|nr:hypothetical protein [Bacilli bacterium]
MTRKDIEKLGFNTDKINDYKEELVEDKSVLNIVKIGDVSGIPDISKNKIKRYKSDKIKELEHLIKVATDNKNELIEKYDALLNDLDFSLGTLKSKGIKSLLLNVQEVMPCAMSSDEARTFSKALNLEFNVEVVGLLGEYFKLRKKYLERRFILNFPKSIANLFIDGDINHAYYDNLNDINELKNKFKVELNKFYDEKQKYLFEFNPNRMGLYKLKGQKDIYDIEKYINSHRNKISLSTYLEITNIINMIQKVINKGFMTRKKKEQVAQLCFDLIDPVNNSIDEVKAWYLSNIYNSTLGIVKTNYSNNLRIENVINNPKNSRYLYSLIDKREMDYLELEKEIQLVECQLKITDTYYYDNAMEIVEKMTKSSSDKINSDAIEVLNRCYSIANHSVDGDYIISYTEPKEDQFINLVSSIILLKNNSEDVKVIKKV